MFEEAHLTVTNDADSWFRQKVGPLLWSRQIAVEVGGAMSSLPTYVWVAAVRGDEVLGIGAIDPRPGGIVVLRHAWVAPEWRKRGIGTAIVRKRIELARQVAGVQRLRVTARPEAARIYGREGFQMVAVRGVYQTMELRP